MIGLSRERILETAIRMADEDGFDAVTLRRIATELGVHVTSLYNHVPTREAVTDGMVELLIDEAKLPATPVGWEQWVRTFFNAMGTLAQTHPGAFTALERRPVQGPKAAAAFEIALAAFTKAGLTPEDAYSAMKATTLTALTVGLERSMMTRGLHDETDIAALPAADFPLIRAVSDLADPEGAWSFILEALVSGLRAQIRARRTRTDS